MTLRQRPNRQPLALALAPDLLERLHPGTHPSCPHPLELNELATVNGRSDAGGASSSVHTGATSDVHTHYEGDELIFDGDDPSTYTIIATAEDLAAFLEQLAAGPLPE
ncbi:MAG: hypothetical protein ACR2LK_01830 [Solirubrobacteraceae bacterium]